jgi:hypothetical protein
VLASGARGFITVRGGGVGAWLVRNSRLQCQLKPLIGRREIKEV